MADPVDRFMNQIQGIEKRLLDDLKMIAKRMDKLSDTELVAIAKELDFFQELLDRGYSGDGTPPEITADIRTQLSERYIELYSQLTGNEFETTTCSVEERILSNLKKAGYLK